MKPKKVITLLSIFCCLISYGQQSIRVNYAFLYKGSPSQSNYKAQMDMMLDFSMNESVFYSEASFLHDSLSRHACDEYGNVINEEEWSKVNGLSNSSFNHTYHISFSNMTYDVYRKYMSNVFLGENGILSFPEWTISEETNELFGYSVRKATAQYMGRNWTVWFTEEIPVPGGPWLLWGCPGLIVFAIDEDKLFNFYILGEQEIAKNRWPYLKEYYARANSQVQHLSIKEEEAIKCRAERDFEYHIQLLGGMPGGVLRDRDGNAIKTPSLSFEPLIPESFWKKKK